MWCLLLWFPEVYFFLLMKEFSKHFSVCSSLKVWLVLLCKIPSGKKDTSGVGRHQSREGRLGWLLHGWSWKVHDTTNWLVKILAPVSEEGCSFFAHFPPAKTSVSFWMCNTCLSLPPVEEKQAAKWICGTHLKRRWLMAIQQNQAWTWEQNQAWAWDKFILMMLAFKILQLKCSV